jgi:hypothetical protein
MAVVMAGMNDWQGWLPIRIDAQDERGRVDWCRFDRQPLHEPFFHDSVERALRKPFNQALRRHSDLDTLLAWQAHRPGVEPTAFVFHASRCGSTLLAQMLARLDSHIVLSEPPPLDTLLRAHYARPALASRQAAWVRALLSAYGQPRLGGERALVVKLDAWNIAELPLLRRCHPHTPWLFLYRDPLEIAVSQLQSPGRHMVPGLLGASPLIPSAEEALGWSRAEFVAHVLGRLLAAGLEHCAAHGGVAVNYDELPAALVGRLPPLLGLDAAATAPALAGAQQHAKRPGEVFEPDRLRKQRAADEDTRRQIERWARPAYLALEARRAEQGATTASA